MKARRIPAGASLSVLLLLQSAATAASQPDSQFLWLSDIHFDPTVNAALVDRLAEAEPEEWSHILVGAAGPPSTFGADTNWPLFAIALQEIGKTAQQAQFTVLTGDVFVHDFREKFNRAASNHDDEAFRRFAAKTFQFVAAQLRDLLPGKPVIFTLGNNDGDCGDYALQPGGPFLSDTAAALANMLGPLANETIGSDWRRSGSYSVAHPVLKRVRMIALNSVYFSPKYRDSCSAKGQADPGPREMDWLRAQLADARAHRDKVWLLFHIGPGIDGYASSHPKNGAQKHVVPMWQPVYNQEFQDLLERYRDTVTVSLAGHEHTDDFRLIDHALVLLTPALSPLVGQSPAFRLVTYRSDGKLADATTYYLSNLAATNKGDSPDWKAEYNFAQAWHVKGLNFSSFRKLDRSVQAKQAMQAQWSTFYSVSHPEGHAITPETFPWLFCAAGNTIESNYNTCLQQMRR